MFFGVLTLGICILADRLLVSVAVLLVMGLLTVRKGRVKPKLYVSMLLIPFSFLTIGIMGILLAVTREKEGLLAALQLGNWFVGISKAGLSTGLSLFLKSMAAVSCLYFISLTTPMIDMLQVLGRIGLPALVIDLMGLIYRFLFLLMETGATMLSAQNSRLGYATFQNSFRSMGALSSTLFLRAYKRGERTYTAMESRGYDGTMRVLGENYTKNRWNYAWAALFNVALLIAAWSIGQMR